MANVEKMLTQLSNDSPVAVIWDRHATKQGPAQKWSVQAMRGSKLCICVGDNLKETVMDLYAQVYGKD